MPLKGYKQKQEHKRNLSIANKGKRNSPGTEFKTGHKIRLGTKHTLATKQKMKEHHKGTLGMKFSIETKRRKSLILRKGESFRAWKSCRMEVLYRDNFTCQVCGLHDPEIMQVDHKLPKGLYPNLEFDMNNLESLCPNCHERKTRKEKRLIRWPCKKMKT